MEFLDTIVQYKIEIAIPIVVYILIKGLKRAFKQFWAKNHFGYRLMCFLPLILGTLLGLVMTKYSLMDRMMLGAALGGLSHFIYKSITVLFISRVKMVQKMKQEGPAKEKPADSLEAGA